jgi:hypothetical protein
MNLTFNKPLITLIITIIMFKSTQCLTCYNCDSINNPNNCGEFVDSTTPTATCSGLQAYCVDTVRFSMF